MKKNTPDPDLRARTLPVRSLTDRSRVWIARLTETQAPTLAAAKMYKGQHWAAVRRLPASAEAAGLIPDLWVISAGYGLIHESAPIAAYSATFAASDNDSVCRREDGDTAIAARAWWRQLGAWVGPVPGAPRTLSALAEANSEAAILLVAGPSYVRALSDDLREARKRLVDANQLVIITSRDARIPETLLQNVVPSEAPLQAIHGGALSSLHARTAQCVLSEAREVPLRAEALVVRWTEIVEGGVSTSAQARARLTDDDLRVFIRAALAADRSATATSALRGLRANEQACEQKRFSKLFANVKETEDAS